MMYLVYPSIYIMQAESAVLYIPTLNFEYAHSSSGGKFTTVEGMLTDIRSQLQKCNPFVGDSAKDSKLKEFLDKLTEVCRLECCIMTRVVSL